MGIRRWIGEQWADAKYEPPITPTIRHELRLRTADDMLWAVAGFLLIVTNFFEMVGGFIMGLAMWDMTWVYRVTTLNLSPRWIKRDYQRRCKRPKVKR